jgi:integrase
LNRKTGKQMANQNVGKNDSRYWLPRVFKPVNDRGEESPHYSMRVQFKGRRMAFALGTANREAAARRARDVYIDLLSGGVAATLAKHRTQKPVQGDEVATIGEWIEAAEKVFAGTPATFAAYARSLRYIAADIAKVQRHQYSRKKVLGYRRRIDAAGLDILTPEAIQAWRIAFVARAKGNPAKERSAKISANTFMRQARSIFGPKIRKFVTGLRLPEPLPFAGAELYPRESMRYFSKIDPGALLRKASDELAKEAPEVFKTLILALGAGLRRGEIDSLQWSQVDCDAGEIFLEVSEDGRLKTDDSAGIVEIDEALCDLLRGYKKMARQQFVIESDAKGGTASKTWGNRYRCSAVFERVNYWLRVNGVTANKPLHTLRKEAGAIIATKKGIYAASRFLRHADIGVTAAHYADHKERVTVDFGVLIEAKRATQTRNLIPASTSTKRKR